MLNIENVSKRYGKTLANDGVSFAVAGGELAVLLGPNGAGKSTLIKCVDLPAPFGPSSTASSPPATAKETPSLASVLP